MGDRPDVSREKWVCQVELSVEDGWLLGVGQWRLET